MKALTYGQLDFLLRQLYAHESVIFESTIKALFEKYGDDYFKDDGDSPFELCEENPVWEEGRGKFSWIPTT